MLILILIIAQTSIATSLGLKNDINISKEDKDLPFIKETQTYRLNQIKERDYFNHNLYSNQKTTGLFQSLTYNNIIDLALYTGCQAGTSTISCDDNNTLFSLLFNVKKESSLEKIYAVNKDVSKVIFADDNIKYNLEELIKKETGIENIFNKITLKGTLEDDKYLFNTDYNYYLIDIEEDGETYNILQTYTSFKLDKEYSTGEETIYVVNEKKLQEIYDYLAKNQIEYTNYQDNYLEGTINVDENQMIFTSIPYDEFWEIKIDNKIVKPKRILDSLIGIETTPGEHKITMTYKPKYKLGFIISIITLISILFIYLYPKKKKI